MAMSCGDDIILFDFGGGFIFFLIEAIDPIGCMAIPEGLDVVLEGSLMLEVGAADAVPELSAVLLVGAPVPAHSECFAAFPAHKGFDAVLALVVCLQRSEVLEWLGSWVVYVVPAPSRAAVAWQPKHPCRLRPSQRFWPLSVLRSMPPHMHLHVIIAVERLAANWTRELSGANKDLGGGRDPVLPFVQSVDHQRVPFIIIVVVIVIVTSPRRNMAMI